MLFSNGSEENALKEFTFAFPRGGPETELYVGSSTARLGVGSRVADHLRVIKKRGAHGDAMREKRGTISSIRSPPWPDATMAWKLVARLSPELGLMPPRQNHEALIMAHHNLFVPRPSGAWKGNTQSSAAPGC